MEVGGVDGTAPAVVQQGGIDHGGVGRKGHGSGEAIEEDAGHERTLGVLGDLLLDDGGHSDGGGHVGAVEAELGADLSEAVDHGGKYLERGGVAGEAVGVGEEIAFERVGAGAGGEEVGDELGVLALGGEEGVTFGEAGGLGCGGDVEDVIALGEPVSAWV